MNKKGEFELRDLLRIIPYYGEGEAMKLRDANKRIIVSDKPLPTESNIDMKSKELESGPKNDAKGEKGHRFSIAQLAGTAGGGWLAYEIAKSLMPEEDRSKKDKSTWMKVLSELIPIGAAGLGAYGGYKLSKSAAVDKPGLVQTGTTTEQYKPEAEKLRDANGAAAVGTLGQAAVLEGIRRAVRPSKNTVREIREELTPYRNNPLYGTLEEEVARFDASPEGRALRAAITTAESEATQAAARSDANALARANAKVQAAKAAYNKRAPTLPPPKGAQRYVKRPVNLRGWWENAMYAKRNQGWRGFAKSLLWNDAPKKPRYTTTKGHNARSNISNLLWLPIGERLVQAARHGLGFSDYGNVVSNPGNYDTKRDPRTGKTYFVEREPQQSGAAK